MTTVINGTTGVSLVQPGIIVPASMAAGAVEGGVVTPFCFRNKIINGNLDFWQVGTSLSAGTGARYLADMFYTYSGGSTVAPSQQAFALGQTDVPREPAFFHRSVVASSAGAGNFSIFGQKVEGVRTLAGKSATLTFYAKADAAKNIAFEGTQNFGSGGSPSSAVTGIAVTTCSLTTSWQKFTIPITFPSISGKTLGSNGNDCIELAWWLEAGSTFNSRTNSLGQQSGTFDIAQVQLEEGSIATPFEMRPKALELTLCKRYFEIIMASFSCGAISGSSQTLGGCANYSVEKRALPAITLFSDISATAFPAGLCSIANQQLGSGWFYKQSTGANVNAGWGNLLSIDARL